MLFFSKFVVNISVKIISILKNIILFIYKGIAYPIKIIYKFTKHILINPIIRIGTKFNKTVVENVKKVYNIKRKPKISKT